MVYAGWKSEKLCMFGFAGKIKNIYSFTVAGQANTHYMFTLAEKHEWSVAYAPHLRREFREESEGPRDRGNACFNLRGDRASSRSAVQVSAYCY